MAYSSNQKFGLLLLFILSLFGCSKFQEQYFLRDKKYTQGDLPNYYRVTVEGRAFGSSRYIAGWFSENAVDSYFNEISPPANQKFQNDDNASENKVVSVDPANQNKKLVLLLSSDSDIIASQIGALAENEQLVGGFTNLLNKSTILEGYEANQSLSDLKLLIQNVEISGNSTIALLNESSSKVNVEAAVLQYLNLISSHFGNATTFRNLSDAENWWIQNRYLILNK